MLRSSQDASRVAHVCWCYACAKAKWQAGEVCRMCREPIAAVLLAY